MCRFKKSIIPDCIFIFNCRCEFQAKMIYATLFYLHGEPICYFCSKLRDIEWKGLKKSCLQKLPLCQYSLKTFAHHCMFIGTNCLAVWCLGVSITSRNKRVGCHSRCTATEVSLLCMFQLENLENFALEVLPQTRPSWTEADQTAVFGPQSTVQLSYSPDLSRFQEPSLPELQPVLGRHLGHLGHLSLHELGCCPPAHKFRMSRNDHRVCAVLLNLQFSGSFGFTLRL